MCYMNDHGIGSGTGKKLNKDDKFKQCLRQKKLPDRESKMQLQHGRNE